ncbi:MAG: hypothetical protein P4L84_17095 [Isosphaeraceae bacterium]|nr:hypothetical protein [Isosphaeraceae bacterium]
MLKLKRKPASRAFRPTMNEFGPILVLESRVSAATLIFGAAGTSQAVADVGVLDWTGAEQADAHTSGSYAGGSEAASEDDIVVAMNLVFTGMGFTQVPGCIVDEDSTSSISVSGTAPVVGAYTSAISINASFATTDLVDANANGPYAFAAFPGPTSAGAGASLPAATPDTWTVGSDSGPTEDVTFAIGITLSPQTANFARRANLTLHSTGFNVVFAAGPASANSMVVTDPSTSSTLYSNSYGDGTLSITDSYTYTVTLAAGTVVSVDYTTALASGPSASFNNSVQSQESGFSWTFTITANPS